MVKTSQEYMSLEAMVSSHRTIFCENASNLRATWAEPSMRWVALSIFACCSWDIRAMLTKARFWVLTRPNQMPAQTAAVPTATSRRRSLFSLGNVLIMGAPFPDSYIAARIEQRDGQKDRAGEGRDWSTSRR